MTLRRLAVSCALALLAGGLVPAEASHTLRTLTVRGSRNAYVDVTFKSSFRLYRDEFDGNPPVFSAKGAYAGVYLTRLGGGDDESPSAGTLLVAGMPGWRDWALGFGTGDYLSAGRYRVHLLADAQATVKVSVAGLAKDLTLTPTTRSRTRGRLVHRTVNGVDLPVDRTFIPVNLRAPTMTVLAASHDATGAGGDQRICLHTPDDARPCELGGGIGGGFTVVGTPGAYGMGTAMFVYPGEAPAGEAEAEYVDATVGVPDSMYAFALTIE